MKNNPLETILYHNPRCSKSRQTLELLRQKGVVPTIIEYLDTPPDAKTLKSILDMLGIGPREMMRKKEKPYTELRLDDQRLSDEELIKAMVAEPILIERPILINHGRAAIGRPPESVLEIL